MNAILAGFRRLGRFSGRDAPGVFWPYAGVVLVLGFVAMGIVMSIQMQGFITEAQAFAVQHPDRVEAQIGPGGYSVSVSSGDPAFMPDMTGAALGMGAVLLVMVGLLAAAVTRRLHDGGRSGLWALPTVVFLGAGLLIMPRLMSSLAGPEPDMGLFGLMFVNNAAYLISLGLLLVLLILPGKPGPNRFGPPSD